MTDDLAHCTRQGNGNAFASLVERHRDSIWCIASNLCSSPGAAVEVTRQTFLSAHREILSRPADAGFRIWLRGLAVKTAIAERQRTRFGRAEAGRSRFVGDGLARTTVPRLLREALDRVDDEARTAFVLCDLVELPATDAAAILGTSRQVVRQRVHVARLALKGTLDRLWSA